MKKRYKQLLGNHDIHMPEDDIQALMTLADDFRVLNNVNTRDKVLDIITGSSSYNDGQRQLMDVIDATVLA